MAQDGIKRPEDDNGRLLGSEQAFVLANWTKSALAVKYMDKYRISDKKPSMPKTEKEKTFDKLKGSLKGIKSIVGGGKSTIDFTPDGDSENDDLENDLD